MDDRRFDALAKAAGRAPSRRRVLGLLGGGGLLAGLGATVGRGPAPARAASAACVLDFVGSVRLGPSAGQLLDGGTTPGELRGQLSFTLDQTGALAQGELALADGSTVSVAGQTNGQAITLRLTMGDTQVVVAVGAAELDLTTCQGAADGLLTGPRPGDLGDWHGRLSGDVQTTTSGNTGTSGTTGTSSSGNQTTPEPTATSTTAPEPTVTTTVCADALTDCDGVCNDLQNDVTNCGACGNVCPEGQPGFVAGCVEGDCFYERKRAEPCDTGLTTCAGVCVDTTSDAANCGACGTACGAGQICFGGLCATDHRCADGEINCGGACVNTTSDAGNCGGCGNACGNGQICFGGSCATDHRGCADGEIKCGDTCVAGSVCP